MRRKKFVRLLKGNERKGKPNIMSSKEKDTVNEEDGGGAGTKALKLAKEKMSNHRLAVVDAKVGDQSVVLMNSNTMNVRLSPSVVHDDGRVFFCTPPPFRYLSLFLLQHHVFPYISF